jgi:hypothetical protein
MPINEKGEFVRARSRAASTGFTPASVSALTTPSSPSRGLSIASLVLGLVSLLCTGVVTAPVAVVIAIAALVRIQKDPSRNAGRGIAWWGLATASLALLISAGWIMAFLSNVIKTQSQTSQRPAATYSTPQTSSQTLEKPETNTAVIFGWLRQSASTYGSVSSQFEVRILSGSMSTNRIIVQVRETSIDYNGSWAYWIDVLRQTYVSDDLGNRYQCDWSQSSGSTDGPVQAGNYREGTLIFPGTIPQNVSNLTLNFAYYPGYSPISVQSAVVRDPSQTQEQASSADRRPLEHDISVNVGNGYEGNEQQFEIRMVRGFVYPDRVALRIRETSINCECPWIPWREVVAASYITDNTGNRYPSDQSHSMGWNDGIVSPGGYREGTIVFWGAIPQNASQITLTFAWIPSRPISMNLPIQ